MDCETTECATTTAMVTALLECIVGMYILYKCGVMITRDQRRRNIGCGDEGGCGNGSSGSSMEEAVESLKGAVETMKEAVETMKEAVETMEEPRAYMRKIRSHDKIEPLSAARTPRNSQ